MWCVCVLYTVLDIPSQNAQLGYDQTLKGISEKEGPTLLGGPCKRGEHHRNVTKLAQWSN